MSDDYKFDVSSIKDVAYFSSNMTGELTETLRMAEALKNKVESYKGWQGKQKEELVTFLNLLTKYHKDLVSTNDAPFNQYREAFQELLNNIEGYQGQSKSYKELNQK